MEAVGRVSIVDVVIRELKTEIARGTWKVGEKIPSEGRLADTLGVSRLSIREAVRVLVHMGLLATRQGAGTFVTASEADQTLLRRHLAGSAETDILDVRRGLDIVAARLAAVARTAADVDALREALERRAAAREAADVDAFTDADVDFHVRIAEASHNPLLRDLYRNMSEALRATVRSSQCIDAGDEPFHDELFAAVDTGDAGAATAAALAILEGWPPPPSESA
ncbi:FadR/GntR family transcriptional regulator [Streptomyces sp. NPDC050145]|uniref:FadR/GntR family transcriptional regulator n=1 Tax=Streptomyces sp. NPDC050145 TaxID=3365602 RepID=UPI0037927279